MIACLAATAFIGVLGVFVGGWDLLGRLMATAGAGAVAAIMMMRSTIWLERPHLKRAGTFSMCLSLLLFAITFLAIWLDSEWRFWITLLLFFGTGWVAAWLVRALETPTLVIAARVGLAIDALVTILCLIEIWIDSSIAGYHFGETGGLYAASGPIACACLIGLQKDDKHWWRWIGVGATTLAALIFTYGIFNSTGGGPEIPAVILSIGVAIAHMNLMVRVPLKGGQSFVRIITILLALVTIGLVDILLVTSADGDNFLTRTTVAAGILATCSTLAMIVLAFLNRALSEPRDAKSEMPADLLSKVSLTCPVCAKAMTVAAGSSSCDGCGLQFLIKMREPRCQACGYNLLNIKSDKCPECGAAGASLISPLIDQPA